MAILIIFTAKRKQEGKQVLKIIKNWLYKRKLTKDEKLVTRHYTNPDFSGAVKIGLLGFARNEEHLKKLEAYMHKLQQEGKEVNMLLFFPHKEIPHFCMPRLSVDFVPKKMLNWYSIPQGKKIRDFQRKPFDLLIDLCLEPRKETLYVVATSKASMKVGLYKEERVKYYDFMLSCKNADSRNLDNYIREVEKYLKKINTAGYE
ncbi:MAG: hypothetical protein R6U19_09530 [Bacteroidales bacterium]